MDKIIPLHIIGGLGDVTIGRKLKFLLLNPDVSKHLGLISILDRYSDVKRIHSEPRDFLEKDVKPNFKTVVQEEVLDALANRIKSGGIRYYCSERGGTGIEDFFRGTKRGDVIDISTPNLSHISYLERAANETQANITVEKPVVANASDIIVARNIVLAAKRIDPKRIFVDQEHYSHYELIMKYIDHLSQNVANFGKIKEIKIEIREQEGFESQRNKNVINRDISGGGIWLDLGPHVMSFLTSLGSIINRGSIRAERYKSSDPNILGEEYKETRMDVSLEANSPYFLRSGAKVDISVGKAADTTRKVFEIKHENGWAKIDIGNKTYTDSLGMTEKLNAQEPFLNSYIDLIGAVKDRKQPRTPIEKSLETLTNLFEIQTIADSGPMINYHNWK